MEGALKEADKVCPELNGTYTAAGTVGGYKGNCVDWNNKQIQFQIWHIQEGERILSTDECTKGLKAEIKGCRESGGRSRYTNWEYKADPNQGPCPTQTASI
ncbi:hypothetical protein F5B20DRAFT_596843 [Whalleya microplaca]|nr:hypothetical protein F5B20DRAFT_596843 [Whalleya microplaca]